MILHGDCLTLLTTLPAACVQTCVTSPPYWGLRDYGCEGQIGLESTPDAYVQIMVRVFQEVKRVLKDDGTLWLNLGDSYAGYHGNKNAEIPTSATNGWTNGTNENKRGSALDSLKPKDLVGIPWRVAFALQADGWYLRSDIIWAKPNPMPESVTDRPTKSHEYLFLLSKRERYYYDAEAIKEEGSLASLVRLNQNSFHEQTGGPKDTLDGNRSCRKTLENLKARVDKQRGHGRRHDGFNDHWDGMSKEEQCSLRVNKRTVWEIATAPYPDAHFATFPPKLIEPCILAGSRPGDTVLDPFAGSGTTLYVAKELNRQYIGIELNAAYIALAEARLQQEVLALYDADE